MRSDGLAMKMQSKCTTAQRAGEYLKRIAVLTGAEQVLGDCYCVRAGRRNFLVDYKFARLLSLHSKSSCFSLARDPGIPRAEVVGSALLHLKNNPKLFKKWRKQPGYTFKANGKMFRDA